MPSNILLVRHGETDWNAQGRIQGHLQVPLNERGQAQAEAVAARLGGGDVQALYSSDLKRARQTAEAISRACGLEIQLDVRLREWDLGIISGLSLGDARREHPQAMRIYRERIVDTPIPGGESIRQRSARVIDAIEEIAEAHPGQEVAIVSHGGPLGDCYRRAVGVDVSARIRVDLFNAAINHLRIDERDWSVEKWADIAHLEAIGSLGNLEARTTTTDH